MDRKQQNPSYPCIQPILVTVSTVYEKNRVAKLLVLGTSINLCATEPMETTIVKISTLKTVTV